MSYDISVVISTFGDRNLWVPLANRAHISVLRQYPHPLEIIRSHEPTLQQARNNGASRAKGGWLVFLDADDELEPGYLKAMADSDGDLRYPRVRYVSQEEMKSGAVPPPQVLPKRNLLTQGNYMVIGTMMRRGWFLELGGFRELRAYEDWDLFIRFWLAGASSVLAPLAVYRAYRRPRSRNVVPNAQELFHEIASRYRPEAQRKGLL